MSLLVSLPLLSCSRQQCLSCSGIIEKLKKQEENKNKQNQDNCITPITRATVSHRLRFFLPPHLPHFFPAAFRDNFFSFLFLLLFKLNSHAAVLVVVHAVIA